MDHKKLNIICSVLTLVIAVVVFCIKIGGKMEHGINLKNMDITVRPGDDFYDFSTAGWRRANPIPADFSRYGVFDKLRDENLAQLKEIVLEVSKSNQAVSYTHLN